jgi:predicted dehydrogenase
MNISICGLGNMGRNHFNTCRQLNFTIISVYDPYYTHCSYKEYLETLKLCDALIIANPTKLHTKTIIDAFSYNSKLKILCEKPFCYSVTDPLIDEIKQYSRSILIGQIERFNPVCQKINKLLLQKNNIIQIKTSRISDVPSRENLPCRIDMGIHDIDFSCNLMKEIPKNINIYSFDNYHEILVYKINNAYVINEISWKYPFKSRTFEILTTEGIYMGNFFHKTLIFKGYNTIEYEYINVDKTESIKNELSHLKNMVEYDLPPESDIYNNISLLKLLHHENI